MKILVVTVVHRPDDARIRQRQIQALLQAGDEVTYAAPFTDWGVPRESIFRTIDVPRAVGRHRLSAARAARRLLSTEASFHDAILVHDPELVPSLMAVQHPCKIWDVHEDTSAALSMKSWLPTPLRKLTARGVQSLEGRAEGQLHLLLAEQGYVDRFSMRHPVVPNSTPVPESVSDPDQPRAVYVGHISQARGGKDLIAVGSLLRRRGSSMKLEVIGHADPQMATELASAHSNGDIVWHGFLPNASALKIVEGSMAGLSLLHDEPNYRHSKPTKVIEYMARGVPVITTPTPPAQELIERYSCGLVVPFNDPAAVVAALTQLEAEPELRREFARGGRSGALTDHDWNRDAVMFVEQIHQWIEK